MENPTFSVQKLSECLKSSYGIDAQHISILPWGADPNASVYKAQAQDKAYFLKLKQGHQHDIAITITKFLEQAGISQLISPINTLNDQPTLLIEHNTLIVYPFLEACNGFEHPLGPEQWITLGKALRKVQDLTIPSSLQNQLRREDFSTQSRNAVRSWLETSEAEPIGDEIAKALWKFIKENQKAIYHLMNEAERLCHIAKHIQTPFVLCHADIHAGNVLIDKSDNLYVVDWDEPMMAPKERDLMFIGAGIGNVWNKPEEEALFYQGYGKAEINSTLLDYYRYERIIVDIAEFIQLLLLSTQGGESRKLMYQHFIDMFAPNGVVDIACKFKKQ